MNPLRSDDSGSTHTTDAGVVSPLAYFDGRADRLPTGQFARFSLGLGLIPLVVGVLSTVGYVISEEALFVLLGLVALLLGTLAFIVGIALVIGCFAKLGWKPPPKDDAGRVIWHVTLLALIVHLMNWPIAMVCAAVASHVAGP